MRATHEAILASVIARLQPVQGPDRRGWYSARCPFHDDRTPSFGFTDSGFACKGCDRKGSLAVLAGELGVDLGRSRSTQRTATTYDYNDEEGTLLHQTVRSANPKGFKQRRPDGHGGWNWNLKGSRVVLYRLPDVLALPPDQALFVVEGEKDVDRLWAEGLAATTNPMGAGTWRSEFSESLRGRRVVIVPDNDLAGREHAAEVARSLLGVAAELRVLDLPDLPEKGDVSDWFDAGGTSDELVTLSGNAPLWLPDDRGAVAPAQAKIIVTDQFLHRLAEQAWDALLAGQDAYFRHGKHVALVEQDDRERATISHPSIAAMKGRLDRSAHWYRVSRQGESPARPPKDVVEDMLALPRALPVLRGLTGTPVFSRDGTLETTPGYQASTGLYYEPVGEPIPSVPAVPDATDVKRAKAIIGQEWLPDFPFVDDASRAHALAVPLTVVAREMILGPTPLFAIDAPAPGSGKGLLAEGIGILVTGRAPAVMSETRGEEERKRITALVLAGHPLILLDNVKRRLESATLAAVLTANYWSDRILGRTEEVELPVRGVWMATGNNIQLDTDIARRTVWVRLDARMDRPWERTEFREQHLSLWVERHRHDLVWAFLVLVQHWIACGRPEWQGRTLGSYESWSAVVGGILATAGIGGFLENREELYGRADAETDEWRAFTRVWLADHGSSAVKAADLLRDAQELLPSVFERAKDGAQERTLLTLLGKALAQRRDRSFDGLFIRRVGDDPHAKGAFWRVEPCGTSLAPDGRRSADVPPDNASTPDSFAERAERADVISAPVQFLDQEDDPTTESDRGPKHVPHVPHVPQPDSKQPQNDADVVRSVGVPADDVPQREPCRGGCGKLVPSGQKCNACADAAVREWRQR